MEDNFASELLHQVKLNSMRWFIIALAELIIILSLSGGMLWYFSLPTEEVAVENESGNATYIGNDLNGELQNE